MNRVKTGYCRELPLVRRSSSSEVRYSPRDFTTCSKFAFPCSISMNYYGIVAGREAPDTPLTVSSISCSCSDAIHVLTSRSIRSMCDYIPVEHELVGRVEVGKGGGGGGRRRSSFAARFKASILSTDPRTGH